MQRFESRIERMATHGRRLNRQVAHIKQRVNVSAQQQAVRERVGVRLAIWQ